MINKDKDIIKEIIDNVFDISIPKLQEARKEQISNLIHTVINGDTITNYLANSVNIKNSEREIYIYVLTNNRIVILTISTDSNKINTYPFTISEMRNVVFNSPELEKMSVVINLNNNQLLGLEYAADRQDVTNFFQELDQMVKNKNL